MTLREAFPEVAAPAETKTRKRLELMATMAENGRWCQRTALNGHGQRCALGLAAFANGYTSGWHWDLLRREGTREVLEALYQAAYGAKYQRPAIPAEDRIDGVIAEYNDSLDTRMVSPQDWFRAAKKFA